MSQQGRLNWFVAIDVLLRTSFLHDNDAVRLTS
jgi:hypothetical protein